MFKNIRLTASSTGEDRREQRYASSVGMSPTSGTCWASVFTGAVVEALTSESSPLHTGKEIEFKKAGDSKTLQPDEPTPQQKRTHLAFCQSIVSCSERIKSDNWRSQFTFGAQEEHRHFPRLPTIPPNTQQAQYVPGFAGITRQDDLFTPEKVASNSLQSIASIFLATCMCPESWRIARERQVAALLQHVAQGRPVDEIHPWNPAALMSFRLKAAQLSDTIVETIGLPKPRGEICILWKGDTWHTASQTEITDFESRWRQVFRYLSRAHVEVRPMRDEGPPFYQFELYLAASIIETRQDEDETVKILDAVTSMFNSHLEEYGQNLLAKVRGQNEGLDWYKSLGLQRG